MYPDFTFSLAQNNKQQQQQQKVIRFKMLVKTLKILAENVTLREKKKKKKL